MRLETKKNIVDELHEKFMKSTIVIVTDYKGLDVASMNSLRNNLREEDIEYKVVKNTLLRKASEGTGVNAIIDDFKGPTAVAISYTDAAAPARVLTKFAKDNKNLEIQSGVMDGKALDLSSISALSSLPSREVLLGQVLSAMNGVPTGFVRALNDIPRRFVNVLQAIKDKKEEE